MVVVEFSDERMELDCPVCGKEVKAEGRARQACLVINSSPIVHDLFNELRGWDNSTRNNFFTQLALVLRHPTGFVQ